MDPELIDALSEEFGDAAGISHSGHGIDLDLSWEPRLNPTQRRVYDCTSDYVLAYGERGTGKSIGGLHKAVKHCVHNKNALYFIVVREVGQATEGGAWTKLQIEILPQWERGNFDRKTGKYLDKGCGIQWTAPKLDPQDKKPYIWITNKFGGYSMIKLISLFVGEHVEDKVKGKEPSGIFLDEAQTTESDEYFTKIVQQVGRRQDITDNQQVVYSCNPKGPSHWLYRRFFCHQYDEEGNPLESPIDEKSGHPVDPATGALNQRYAIFHVPIEENKHNLVAGYWDKVLEAVKNDPIEYQRMVQGLWVDKPEGDALFKDEWSDLRHLRGDMGKNLGLVPSSGFPLILSWDPGAAHTSVTWEQFVPTVDKLVWAIVDETNCVGRYVPYRELVPRIIKRMQYWEQKASDREGKKVEFRYIHVADDSAFNQFRAEKGSFDAQDIENISKEYVEQHKLPERFIIKMKAAPKGQHSVEARVRIVKDLLVSDSLVVSATCIHTRAMFMQVECDKDNRMKPKRSRHLHPFDSLSYAMIYFNSGAGRPVAKQLVEPPRRQEFFKVGSR